MKRNRNVNPIEGQLPRVFLSYRWESEELKAWVRKFADGLIARDVEVLFDEYLQKKYSPYRIDEIDIVHRMEGCHVYMPIFTRGYFARVGIFKGIQHEEMEDGWVFDESQKAAELYDEG